MAAHAIAHVGSALMASPARPMPAMAAAAVQRQQHPNVAAAKAASKKRVCYAEGEEERVLRAVQIVVDEDLA